MKTNQPPKKKKAKLIAGLMSATLLTGFSVVSNPPTAHADPIAEEECYPAVLMLRGSGEPSNEVSTYLDEDNETILIETNGHEGPTLRRAVEALIAQTDPAETISQLRFVGIDYPALDIHPPAPSGYPDTTGLPSEVAEAIRQPYDTRYAAEFISYYLREYTYSINRGGANVANFISDDKQRGCNTQYLLMGYSQGALAARVAMNLLGNNTDIVVGSYLIGDPFQEANAAWTRRQISEASTGSDKTAPLRHATQTLKNFGLLVSLAPEVGSDAARLHDTLTASDATAYIDRGISGVTSRSLCHERDPVCWDLIGSDSEEHTNYFKTLGFPTGSSGYIDVEKDIPEFEKQLQFLAATQTANPRERTLSSSTAVKDQPTVYHIANARPDDLCSWDEGSDGSFEEITVPCATYESAQVTDIAKMTVTVLDSFGTTHTLATEEEVVDPDAILNITEVPYDKWVRYESYTDPTECITMEHDFNSEYWAAPESKVIKSAPCLESPSQHVEFNATQVFKRTQAKNDDDSRLLDIHLWGYDDDYKISSGTDYRDDEGHAPVTGYVGWHWEGDYGRHDDYLPRVELAQIRDGIPYYQMKFPWGGWGTWCVTHDPTDQVRDLDPCDETDENQLFKAVISDDDYGVLSWKRDAIPPAQVTGLEVTRIDTINRWAYIKWNPSIDDRTDEIDQYIIEVYDQLDNSWERDGRTYGSESDATQWTVYLNWPEERVRVSACDFKRNCSPPTELTISWSR